MRALGRLTADHPAWDIGPLSGSTRDQRDTLIASGQLFHALARDVISQVSGRNSPPSQVLQLVTGGVIRTFVASETRRATIRYARSGDVIGLGTFLNPLHGAVSAEAVTDSDYFEFPAHVVQVLMLTDGAFARTILHALLQVQGTSMQRLLENVFRPNRERVARHLLEMSHPGVDGSLDFTATHQEIAEAIGSVREVVSRIIADFTAEGLLLRRGVGSTITRPDLLRAIADQGSRAE